MRVATWNLNNRVGKVRFRPEAAHAAVALNADLLVFTEYFPREHHEPFCQVLAHAGWPHQLLSPEPMEVANRVLIASRWPLERDGIAAPGFDHQFPANVLAVCLPTLGLRVLGLRVPVYEQAAPLRRSWEWLEGTAAQLQASAAIILGDLNVSASVKKGPADASFRRILNSGWRRAAPASGHSYYGHSGQRSEIDHILATPQCKFDYAEYVTAVSGFTLAGTTDAISDHAALVAVLDTCNTLESRAPHQ